MGELTFYNILSDKCVAKTKEMAASGAKVRVRKTARSTTMYALNINCDMRRSLSCHGLTLVDMADILEETGAAVHVRQLWRGNVPGLTEMVDPKRLRQGRVARPLPARQPPLAAQTRSKHQRNKTEARRE